MLTFEATGTGSCVQSPTLELLLEVGMSTVRPQPGLDAGQSPRTPCIPAQLSVPGSSIIARTWTCVSVAKRFVLMLAGDQMPKPAGHTEASDVPGW